jgi:hypothetical protein
MLTFTTQEQYTAAKEKQTQYDAACKQWMKENKTNSIPIEVAANFPYGNEMNNDIRSAIEVWEFTHNPPDKYFLFINEKENTATTWTGQILGTISLGYPYFSNFGDKRQPVTIKAINGKVYTGTYYKGSGNYAHVKISKKLTEAQNNQSPTDPQFKLKNGELTAYAFACGYVEWESKDGTELSKWDNGKELYMEHGRYHVKRYKDGARVMWETFDRLGEARKYYHSIHI